MDRELDVWVAEVLGWTRVSCYAGDGRYAWHLVDDETKEWVLQIEYWRSYEDGDARDADGRWDAVLPHYSTSIAAAREMEDTLTTHAQQTRYAMAMMSVFLEGDIDPQTDEDLWWMCLYATPEQRCRAFVLASKKVEAVTADEWLVRRNDKIVWLDDSVLTEEDIRAYDEAIKRMDEEG